jgi:hypothetical protein
MDNVPIVIPVPINLGIDKMDSMLQMLFGPHLHNFIQIEMNNQDSVSQYDCDTADSIQYVNTNKNKIVELEENVIENVKENDSDSHIESIPLTPLESKILINVGGKKFKLIPSVLQRLDIKLDKLALNDNEYFLDRDGYYFQEIVQLLNKINGNKEILENLIEDFSDQMIIEMIYYKLLSEKFKPEYKIRIKTIVSANVIKSNIIKIYTRNVKFETFESTLSWSRYLTQHVKTGIIRLDIDSTVFRYVLNFLRTGELYTINKHIINAINILQIQYDSFDSIEKSNDFNIISVYEQINPEISIYELSLSNNLLNHKFYPIRKDKKEYYHFNESNKYINSDNSLASYNSEYLNIINTKSNMAFGNKLDFDLTVQDKLTLGDLIEDLTLVVDLPVLNPNDNLQYVNNVGFKLLEQIDLTIMGNNIMETNGDYLYLYPILYLNQQYKQYHAMANIRTTKCKIIYDNHLIDVNRLIIPLHLIKSRSNNLPIHKMIKNNWNCHLYVKLSSLNDIIQPTNSNITNITNIPLLNVFIQTNYVNIGTHIKQDEKLLYIYDHLKQIRTNINQTNDKYFNVTNVLLDDFFHMKDLIIVIHKHNSSFHEFINGLIEMEILIEDKLYQKFDMMLLTEMIPLKRLGHTLPDCLYYYSFSFDPYDYKINGGIAGKNITLRIRTIKMDGVITVFSNNYQKVII